MKAEDVVYKLWVEGTESELCEICGKRIGDKEFMYKIPYVAKQNWGSWMFCNSRFDLCIAHKKCVKKLSFYQIKRWIQIWRLI